MMEMHDLILAEAMSWPEAFAMVGTMACFAFVLWALVKYS